MGPQLTISTGQCSVAGHATNQDFVGLRHPDAEALATKGIALAVADGISTSSLGGQASEMSVNSFLTDYYCTSDGWSVQSSAESVIGAINSAMHSRNGRPLSDEERERGLICTFSALVLKSRRGHLFHVGDGRIARLRGMAIEALTEPHRVSIGGGKSYLGRALGMDRHVEIDYRRVGLEPGDIFLLTTDGVHDHLPDTRMVELVAGASTLDEAASSIVHAAREAGSRDDLTVQLVRVEALPEGAVDDVLGTEITLPPAPLLTPAREFEGYLILRQIHAGTRSHVYLAFEKETGSLVALKVPSTEGGGDAAQLRALLLEEWVARRIDNAHVAKAVPPRSRAHVFVASEYVEGQTLTLWIADHPAPHLTQMRSLIGQIAAGLLAFHKLEMLHRDLRPQNVMIDAQGTAKIIDFGSVQVAGIDEVVEREFEDAAFAGTMQYSAPELYFGSPASPASDLYSLGVLAYQILTGHLPYGPRVAAARTRAAQRKLRYIPAADYNPAVPDWVDAAIAKAVSIDPAKRYKLLSEFTYDLAHPNTALTQPPLRPLLARNPIIAWQAISFVLAVAFILSLLNS